MNNKIALVTCYFQRNYGSQLQAFATQMIFEKLRIPNETIRIDGLLSDIKKKKYRYFIGRLFDYDTIKDKMATVRKKIAQMLNPEYAKNLSVRYDKFEDFSKTKFHLSKYYHNKKELSSDAYHYRAFIVGSDQLWLPSNIVADYYTLNFVPDTIPKISLSTSFGVSYLSPAIAKKARTFLSRLDYLSVRELSGKQLVKQLIDRDVPVVCDPTMMFTAEEWERTLDAKGSGFDFSDGYDYIFVYFLGNNSWQRELVKKVKEKTNLMIVQIAHSDEYVKGDNGFADYTPYNVGPKEFVELIRDAKYVFTDSFHCTVFSLLNVKQFFTFPRYNHDGPTSTNGRLNSLLSLLHQEERFIRKSEVDTFFSQEKLDFDISKNNVICDLEQLRQKSWDWLNFALKESKIL